MDRLIAALLPAVLKVANCSVPEDYVSLDEGEELNMGWDYQRIDYQLTRDARKALEAFKTIPEVAAMLEDIAGRRLL